MCGGCGALTLVAQVDGCTTVVDPAPVTLSEELAMRERKEWCFELDTSGALRFRTVSVIKARTGNLVLPMHSRKCPRRLDIPSREWRPHTCDTPPF
jgi:hypothetical protein